LLPRGRFLHAVGENTIASCTASRHTKAFKKMEKEKKKKETRHTLLSHGSWSASAALKRCSRLIWNARRIHVLAAPG
jgi:hypothetical protein